MVLKARPQMLVVTIKNKQTKKELCLRELIRFATYHDRIQWQTAYGSKGLKIEVSL